MKIIIIMLSLVLGSCAHNNRGEEQLVEEVFKIVTDSEISYSAEHCPRVEATCADGTYEQWIQKNGEIACACNN